MTTSILLSGDLMFISKVREVARTTHSEVKTVRSLEKLEKALRECTGAGVLMIDLEKPGVPLESLTQTVADIISSGWHVVSFFSHVHEEVAAHAESLGLGEVMPRSRFVKVLPELFGTR